MTIAPIPKRWKEPVIKALQTFNSAQIKWKLRAQTDWQQFGMNHDAYELLIKTLSSPIIGKDESLGMLGAQETWAFLCEHPLNPSTTLYAKIGLKEGHISIIIFSLHTDLKKKELESQIELYLKKNNRS